MMTNEAYAHFEITMAQWTNKPRKMVKIVPTRDGSGWKGRAESLLCAMKPYYSHRLGYALSPSKFAKFERLYAEGYSGNDFSKTLIPPRG